MPSDFEPKWRDPHVESSTVWVLHKIKDDVSPAEQWGKLKYVSAKGYVYADEMEPAHANGYFTLPQVSEQSLKTAVDEFNPRRDYVLIGGDCVQLINFTSAIARKHGKFVSLRFDRKAEGYIPVLVA
jgi:hypothetical protein